jgi:hypothetical protein
MISEVEHTAVWGGSYSIFKALQSNPKGKIKPARKEIIDLAKDANPITLELAATAAFLAKEGDSDPWSETSRRKPEKAAKYLDDARNLYARLLKVKTPNPLPAI